MSLFSTLTIETVEEDGVEWHRAIALIRGKVVTSGWRREKSVAYDRFLSHLVEVEDSIIILNVLFGNIVHTKPAQGTYLDRMER